MGHIPVVIKDGSNMVSLPRSQTDDGSRGEAIIFMYEDLICNTGEETDDEN